VDKLESVLERPTMDAVKKHLDAASVSVDAIPGGFAAMGPWGTSIRFTIVP
jgi:hypothetical protein